MSPEQANGDAVDHRSDLFSLGSVLYAMCTGRPPFRAETTFGVLRRIRETSPRPIREINALKGVTTNFREIPQANSIVMAIVRDPSLSCLRETQRTQKESELRKSINSAFKDTGIPVRWEEGVADEKNAEEGKKDAQPPTAFSSENPAPHCRAPKRCSSAS